MKRVRGRNMKRVRGEDGSKSIDRISKLPKDILHRILYLLSQEEAVRTSVLSKSWRYIWCTRPNFHISETNFKGNKREFLSVVKSSLQRYHDQKLCLEDFRLSIWLTKYLYRESVSLVEKWIPRLTNMGVKESRLWIRSKGAEWVKLPPAVFGVESLQDLYVQEFKLDQETIQKMVRFKHLKSLSLVNVMIGNETFQTIISSCPSVETLRVKECQGLLKIKVNDLPNLKKFSFADDPIPKEVDEELCRIEIQYTQSLEIIEITYGNIWFHKGSDFRNLRNLCLYGVQSSLEHFSSCTFPSLEFLTLMECAALDGIQLCIDAPKIFYFMCGVYIPSISFATTTSSSRSRGECDLDIYLRHVPKNDASSWFFKIKELLKSLRLSGIPLDICSMHEMNDDKIKENIHSDDDVDDDPVVELLRLRCPLSSIPSFFDAVFCICRPSIIYDYRWDMGAIECLWESLMQRESGDKGDWFRKLWKLYLEEVSLEIKETNDENEEWRTITPSELRSYKQMEHITTRFALKWRQTGESLILVL